MELFSSCYSNPNATQSLTCSRATKLLPSVCLLAELLARQPCLLYRGSIMVESKPFSGKASLRGITCRFTPRLGDGETLNSAPGFLLSIYSCAGFGAVPTNGKTSERADLFKSSQYWEVSFWEMRWGLLKLRQGYIHVLQITCYIRRGIYITEMWPFFSFEERR